LAKLNATNKKSFLWGDFNLDLLKLNQHAPTAAYIENVFSNGFLQLITKPTRSINGSATLIDHILTNKIQQSYTGGILINRISDHFPIFHILEATKPTKYNKPILKRIFNDNNISVFKSVLENMGWGDVSNCNDPQESMNLFQSTFLDLFELHFPEEKNTDSTKILINVKNG
jgi:hypothetical protein